MKTIKKPTKKVTKKKVKEVEPLPEIKKIDKLNLIFNNEDMNNIVLKINELVDEINELIS